MEDKRTAIVQQALSLFMENGLSATSMEDVARAMNLGKATIYHYFDSKETLFWASVDLEVSQMEEAFLLELKKEKSGRDKLIRYLDLLFTRIEERYDVAEKRLNFWRELGPKYFDVIQRFSRKEAEILSAIFISGMATGEFRQTDPLKLATMVTSHLWGLHFSVLHGNCFDGFSHPETPALRVKARFFIDTVINGINQSRSITE